VEACKAELQSLTGITIRAIDLMRNAYMEHAGHLETRLALKFKGDDLAFLRRSMGLKPGLDDDPNAGGPSVAEQAQARFGGISKSVWDALNALSAASAAFEYTAACMLLQVGRNLPAITDAPNAPPAPPQTTAVGHDQEERPPRSFVGFYRAQYGAHPDRHAAAVIRAMGNGKRAVPAERAAEMLKIDVGLVTGPVVADAEDSSIGPHNRHLVRADFTTEKARSNARQIWQLLHVNDGKLATIESELYGPYNDEEQRLIRVEFRKLSGGFDLTFYIQQAIVARERTLREAHGSSGLAYGALASTNDWVIAERAKHSVIAIGAEGTAEGKTAVPLGGSAVMIHGSATELDAALAVASHGELDAVDRVRNAVARGEDTEVLRIIDDLSVDERRQVLKNGKLIDDLERKLGQRDYERVFKVLTGQADLADRLYNNSIGRSWWKRHISHAADSSGMKEDVREYIRRLRLDFDRKVRAELAAKFGPQDTPPPPELIEQEINNRTRAACMDLAADKDIKQIIDDVLGSSDRAEIKSTLMNAGTAQDWAIAAGASKTEILGEIKAMSDEERKAKLADPAYLQLLGKRLHDEKDYRDAMNALAAGQDGVGGKDGTTGAGGLAKLDETSRTSVEIHGAKTDGRATLRALAALSRAELDRLAADPQMQLQVMNALSDDTQRALARELLFPAGSALPKSATGLDPQDAARLDHLVRQAVSRLRIACKTSRKWSAVLEEAVEVYKAPLDPASEPERANDTTAAPKNRVPAGLRAEVWKQVLADITAFAADHDAHRGAVTTDDITGAQMIEVARKAVMHEADPSDWLISAKIWTKEERLGGMSSGEASIVGMMVDDEYEESDLIKVLSSASDEHVAREWSSVASEPSGGGETMADRYRIFRASFAKAKAAILRREAATDAAASKASSAPSATSAGDVAAEPTGAGASEPAAAQAPKWSGQVHELRDDDPDILRAEEDKQRFLLYVIQVSRQLEKMLRPFMGDHREVTPDRDPNAAKISGTGNKRYDNLAEIVLARFPRLDPKIIADVIGVEPEDRWILSTAARTEIGMFNLRHEKNLRSRGQQTSERSVASDEKEGLDVSRVVYGRALAVGLTDAQLDKDEVANISHLGDRNDQARDSYKVALETAAMWASLIVGTLVTVVATILTGGLALGPVAAMAVGAATAALSATAKSYVNKQILDNEWDSKDTNELIAHEVLTSVVTIGTTYYAQKFLATLGGLSSAARQATAARAVLAKQPPLWRVFLDQASEQVASEAMSTVVEAGLEATDPKHWIDGYREGSDEAMAAGKARLAAAPEAMARGVVTSLLTASVGKMLRPGGGSHVDFSDAAKQTRSINLARNIKKVFGDPEQKLTGALVEWAMNHEDPIDWSEAPAQLFQGTLNQYGQVATEMHSHTASVAAHGRHAKTQLALYGHEMTAAERAGYEHMNKDAGATDPLISAREYTNLRRQVAETGLGQWEAAHPDHPLDPAQREAFIRWVREAENPDVLKDRAKKNPLDVDVVRDAAPKPASAAPGGAGDAAPGAAHHAGMFHIDANTSVPTTGASQGESHPSQRKTQQMEVPEEQLHPSQRKTQQMEVPEDQLDPAQRRVHEQTPEEQLHPSQRKTQQMEVPEAAIAMSRDVAKEFAVLRDYSVSEDAIGAHQRRQAEEILQRLPEHDYRTFQGLYAHLPTPVGKAFLLKGLAAGHPMNVLHWLVSNMQGRDDYWLIDALTLHDPRGIGVGITQQ
ncbi:MAG TPA: hypothetical protein VFS15_22435, partial [Kofleriaceae bacterium]|nr:hypothetical protein [Kofleriaceae bacterium]